ncbi:MAG: GxxExxY protein [Spirochaetia bacterium]|nr:GxxExxY protein [Spirochaetia bacterium]
MSPDTGRFLLVEATEASENTEYMDEIPDQIIGASIEVHKILGPGLLERIYEEAMCHEFDSRKIQYQRQHFIDFVYKGHKIKGQRLDLMVENEVIVEIKSLEKLPDVAIAQTLSCLKARPNRKFWQKKINRWNQENFSVFSVISVALKMSLSRFRSFKWFIFFTTCLY